MGRNVGAEQQRTHIPPTRPPRPEIKVTRSHLGVEGGRPGSDKKAQVSPKQGHGEPAGVEATHPPLTAPARPHTAGRACSSQTGPRTPAPGTGGPAPRPRRDPEGAGAQLRVRSGAARRKLRVCGFFGAVERESVNGCTHQGESGQLQGQERGGQGGAEHPDRRDASTATRHPAPESTVRLRREHSYTRPRGRCSCPRTRAPAVFPRRTIAAKSGAEGSV